jgi:hypothetical protein
MKVKINRRTIDTCSTEFVLGQLASVLLRGIPRGAVGCRVYWLPVETDIPLEDLDPEQPILKVVWELDKSETLGVTLDFSKDPASDEGNIR